MEPRPNMSPEEERAWVSMAKDGTLKQWANSVITSPYDRAYEAYLRRRARDLAAR